MDSLGPLAGALTQYGAGLAPLANAPRPGQSVESAARGFEEVFLALLVKEMRQGLAPGGMFGHDSGDILGGMFDQFMAQHLAKGAGIGLARALQKHLDQRKADEPAQTDHRV